MVTPVFITQIEEEEESNLSEQILPLNLKDSTSSMSTMTTNTYSPADKTQSTTMAFNINTDKVCPTQVYSTMDIGTTSLTTTYSTPSPDPVDPFAFLGFDYYQAQYYHETTCNKNPKSLLAMAHDMINPKTGFPFCFPSGVCPAPKSSFPFCVPSGVSRPKKKFTALLATLLLIDAILK